MTFTPLNIKTLNSKYATAYDLIINKSKKDPENEPYKSKYEARTLLLELEQHLLQLIENATDKAYVDNRLAVTYYLLGSICYDVEEPHHGDDYTSKSISCISNDPLQPERIICYLSSLNLIGYAACKYDKLELSLEHLEKAEALYKIYKDKFSFAKEFGTLFGIEDHNDVNGLEKCHTQTLFYLAQVYSAKKLRIKAAKYCHTTLRRQLEMKEYDSIEWSLNSATLSQYLIEQNAFREARTHLAAAQFILEKYKEELDNRNEDSEELKALKESLRHRRADVYRCWAKYGLYILIASKERLLASEGDSVDPEPQPPVDLQGLCFPGFEEEIMREYENSVTCNFILTYEDARPVFLKSQEWLNVAKEYYSLEDLASDHVSILQDSSSLYQLLAFFQQDEGIQCKLHKRRLDMLDKAVNELNPVYYMKVCRELWYELGETSLCMADLKQSQAENTGQSHFQVKSQHHHAQGIQYFEKYLKTFNLQNSEGQLQKYPEGYEKSIIMCYMSLGRMYSKLTSQDKRELIKTQNESLRCYRAVLDYCNAHPEFKEEIHEELGICREMAELIPLKILKIERCM